MRDILTIAASLVILVLTAALVGPWFVDWTAQRGWVESELSRISGARVSVSGKIDLTLLPVPTMELERVVVSSTRPTGPKLDIAHVRFELAATSLLKGELRFTDATLARPQLTLTRNADNSFVIPRMPNFAPSGVQIEKLSLTQGSLALLLPGSAQPVVFGGIDFTGEASSLKGPFKGSGQVRLGSDQVRYRFTTGEIAGERLRVKAIVDESPLAPRADLDGSIVFEQAESGARPGFEGAAVFSAASTISGASVPWRLTGALKADGSGATLDGAEARAGDEERAIVASGKADLTFAGAPRMRAQFNARQLDLDRLFNPGAKPGEAASSGARVAALIASALADPALGARLPVPLALSLQSPAAVVAGETLTDVRAEASLAPDRAPEIKLSLFGPARSSLSLDGVVETGAAAALRGRASFGARDLTRFADWVALSAPDLAQRLRDLPFRGLEAAGDVELSAAGAMGRRMTIRADRSELKGTLAYTRASAREPARLFADLTSDALDLDGLPELAGPARVAADMDLSLALEARAVRLERFGAGVVDAGRIGLKLTKEAGVLRLEKLAVEDIGGASFSASGSATNGRAEAEARLDATRLGDLAALVQRIAPGPFAQALSQSATALSPARLTITARAAQSDLGLALSDFKIEGAARGSRLSAQGQTSGAELEVVARVDNPDAVMTLRQLGFETIPLAGLGPGRVQMRAKGSSAAGFQTTIEAAAARSEATFEGRVSGDLGKPRAEGAVRVKSADATPLMRALAIVLPEANASLAIDGGAQMRVADGELAFEKIGGIVAGAFVNGSLVAAPDGERRRWSGDLALDRLSLPFLTSLALGPTPTSRAVWSDQKFAPGLADPPRIDLKVTAARLDLSDEAAARDATLDLRIAPGLVSIAGASMQIGAGRLGGDLTLRRDASAASLSGYAEFAQLALPAGPVSGALTGRVDFTSTGASFAGLAAGLAGSGRAAAERLTVANADPEGMSRLIDIADKGGLAIDEGDLRQRLAREFERGPAALPNMAYDVSIAQGLVRFAPQDAAEASRLTLSYDMRQLSGVARASLVAPRAPKDWDGAPPAATIVWQGRAGAFSRQVEAGPLINAISARAISREAARVQALEADIRERAYFNRRAKAFEFMRRREREVADFLDAQKRAADEALRKTEEERQRDAARPVTDAIGRMLETAPNEDPARLERERAERAERERRRRAAAESARQRAEEALRARPPAAIAPTPAPAGPLDPLASGRY